MQPAVQFQRLIVNIPYNSAARKSSDFGAAELVRADSVCSAHCLIKSSFVRNCEIQPAAQFQRLIVNVLFLRKISMEELRSAEVLDKEIRSDSVKKAEKILAKAEESVRQLLDGVEARVAKEREAAEKKSEERIALYAKNTDASLPLEKQRYLVSYIHSSVVEAMNSYFDKIGADGRLKVLRSLAERAKEIVGGRDTDAVAVGLDEASAEKMLRAVFGKKLASCSSGNAVLLSGEAVEGFSRREGIILRTQDGTVVCRLTLDEKVHEILDEKSCELAKTLFGGRLPE